MSWADELHEKPEPVRRTGTDWIQTTTAKEQARKARRMHRAERQMRNAERRYLRKMGKANR